MLAIDFMAFACKVQIKKLSFKDIAQYFLNIFNTLASSGGSDRVDVIFHLFFMHFFGPGTMATNAQSINSDLQRGQTFTTPHNIQHRAEPISH